MKKIILIFILLHIGITIFAQSYVELGGGLSNLTGSYPGTGARMSYSIGGGIHRLPPDPKDSGNNERSHQSLSLATPPGIMYMAKRSSLVYAGLFLIIHRRATFRFSLS